MASEFKLIAVTPAALYDPAIAIAASRAGATGIVDLEYCNDVPRAIQAIERLGKFAKNQFGIKLGGWRGDFAARILPFLPQQTSVVILTPREPDTSEELIELLRRRNITILFEAVSLEEANLGRSLGADGLICKGHEAGGRVREETAFILLQCLLSAVSIPVWAHGGIGLHTAAACRAAGAAGVVLDGQLGLTRESTLPAAVKSRISRMDGSETVCLGQELDAPYRAYVQPGFSAIGELRRVEQSLALQARPQREIRAEWRNEIASRVGWAKSGEQIWLLGQDAAFASDLAKRFQTVGGVIEGMRTAVDAHIRSASILNPLGADSALARSLGTRFPIMQGPMTRVSDKAEFAAEVAKAGALPFMALALMRAAEVSSLLDQTRRQLGNRPWGVGILGFVPADLREEQFQVIRSAQPPFALIAGGRPDQAATLEQNGIPTYLHVPSPGLLDLFLESGTRRFVFEGRECGGHVGPRSSFVLWNTMIDLLLQWAPGADLSGYQVIFAGGIHDSVSAAMVATMAAPLAERGVEVGVLMGTAYLFTREAVTTGAIVAGFQEEAIRCTKTVLLETGPGHASRCADTSFVELFRKERQRLLACNADVEEIRDKLERLNLGRLRIASKGLAHSANADARRVPLASISEEDQHATGMYMIGQVAALRESVCAVEELHRDISIGSSDRLRCARAAACDASRHREERPCDLAIIGMSCLLPKAPDLRTYWGNILNGVSAITEIPTDRWDWRLYFDPNEASRDKIYSKWGGFLDDLVFDPMRYGIPPNSISSIEPLQLLTLELVRAAMEDSGYRDRPFPGKRASVILGAGGGIADLGSQYAVRSLLPSVLPEMPPDTYSKLPEWTEDSFPGILLNVVAGRVANRFNLGGVNFTVDAACASSLAALYAASKELETRSSDVVIVGGVDTVQNPFGYLCFSKTRALSPSGSCRTFDESADGIVISEGLAVVVLKRLDDAEADGDRIYAVLKGIAGSSDGRAKGLTAPSPDGQVTSLRRAYHKAGFSPGTVGLIEGHGTGTVAGDQAELQSLRQVFEEAGAPRQACAVGSVKSMIGHTKCAAGMAGLIKTALALHSKVLPPTINVTKPNGEVGSRDSPLYVNTQTRPWMNGARDYPRRAGVSSFGFGGTNFHAVLEEYTGDFLSDGCRALPQLGTSELLAWRSTSRRRLLADMDLLERVLDRHPGLALCDLAFTLWQTAKAFEAEDGRDLLTLALVTTSVGDLKHRLSVARNRLIGERTGSPENAGIYFTEQRVAGHSPIAFLFPGQGSQYPGMLGELAIAFPEVRSAFERADHVLRNDFKQPLSSFVFPTPGFCEEDEKRHHKALTQTNVAQPALGAAEVGLLSLLRSLGVQPVFSAGHSYGEYVALHSAGVFDEDTLYRLSEARGRFIREETNSDSGMMVAVGADSSSVAEVIRSVDGVWIAGRNAPAQTVISGTREGVLKAGARLGDRGFAVNPISTACAFHSPLVEKARERLAELLFSIERAAPQHEVFSNTTGEAYPSDPGLVVSLLADHLVKPVEFAKVIETMYSEGARIFLEVGPNKVLTRLSDQILGAQAHLSIACDRPDRSGVLQLHHVLARLLIEGVGVNLDRLFETRQVCELDLSNLASQPATVLPSHAWLVNGSRARRVGGPVHADKAPEVETEKTPLSTAHRREECAISEAMAGSQTNETKSPPMANSSTMAAAAIKGFNAAPVAAHPPSAGPDNASEDVLIRFQRLMKKFLQTQDAVLAHLCNGDRNGMAGVTRLSEAAATSKASSLSIPQAGSTQPQWSLPDRLVSTELRTEPLAARTPANGHETPSAPEPGALTGDFLQIVSERTGYSRDVLKLDADITADLGIDSIKRIEIIGMIQRNCLPPGRSLIPETVEKLAKTKTLGEMAELITDILRQFDTARQSGAHYLEADYPTSQQFGKVASSRNDLPRFVLRAIDRSNRGLAQIPKDRVFLITDDENGVAHWVGEKVRRAGGRAVLLRAASETCQVAHGVYTANLSDADAVAAIVGIVVRQQGPLAGIVHLLPLKPPILHTNILPFSCYGQVDLQVKSLFYLVKATAGILRTPKSMQGSGWLIVARPISGILEPQELPIFPRHGGVAGLVKSIAEEWPEIRCKVLGFRENRPAEDLADRVLDEITGSDTEIQVEFEGRRLAMHPTAAPLDRASPGCVSLNSESVLLLTGGARGITAEVALELAEKYRPTLLLVGRSPLPESKEPQETRGITGRSDLIRAIVGIRREAGQPVTSALARALSDRILQERETRAMLAAVKRAGATVRYYQLDVRNEEGVRDLMADIYARYGRLDGVVHGAGVIEDALIDAKTSESFDRVFDTKVHGALALIRHLRAESLQFLAFFSSMAGCFGNRGQSDYAAANDFLNELARYLDSIWDARVVAFNWGPWTGIGMVSSTVAGLFESRGIQLISTAAGRAAFDDELRYGAKGESQVIIGGGPWQHAETTVPKEDQQVPIVSALRPRPDGTSLEFNYELSLVKDLYLEDHRVDGKPVLPATMAAELLAEVASKGWPELEVVGIRSLQVLKGIVLANGTAGICAVATPVERIVNASEDSEIKVEIFQDGNVNPAYRGTVILRSQLPEPPEFQPPAIQNGAQLMVGSASVYDKLLFHGPRFHCIQEIIGVDSTGCLVTVKSSLPSDCLARPLANSWVIDPILLDAGPQLAIVWARTNRGLMALPSEFDRVLRFKNPDRVTEFKCYFSVNNNFADQLISADVYFVDQNSRLVMSLRGLHMTCSRSLNRLEPPLACASVLRVS